ncbi:hypothetical protein ACIQNU_02550 [Streptomyces sp. NPDC091292]|uniref:hypothetical protein n=1 Tax=Streptomyces sp. NPDC091292 TaxID=3365991 RepID=UPI0038149EC0
MNGPQHYREAERLLGLAHHFTYGDGADSAAGLALATEAQAHATLALVAACEARRPCAECPTQVPAGTTYCSAGCRNAADRHDEGDPDA